MRNALLIGLVGAAACADAGGSVPPPPSDRAPRPVACVEVPAGAPVQASLDEADVGATLCLADGVHQGPLRIRKAITVWGGPAAVVRSPGAGTTVSIAADGARLIGLTVDGSGGRFDLLDAAVHVTADDVTVQDVTIERATFGILVDRSRRVTVRGNRVRGDPRQVMGLRGDGIRLWETSDSLVEDNEVTDSRDLVVWYSPRAHLRRNLVVGSRYATHLMFSHDCVVEHNRTLRSVVGVFAMYTRGTVIHGNLVVGASGGAGMGIGLKDSGDTTIIANQLMDDTVGLYIDNSPVQVTEANRIEKNLFRRCGRAVVFHGGAGRNHFTGNALVDNTVQVENEGGGERAEWRGNYYDDYAGYDLDADGAGDVPYELRSLRGDLIAHHPELRFFAGVPAFALAEAVGRLVPLAEPSLTVRDDRPLPRPPRLEAVDAH